jgi:D-alanyl-D-alanine carboxypeptidase/D-alanyl-D-alanine-endopeptidase (penicillin-binding protein 4)
MNRWIAILLVTAGAGCRVASTPSAGGIDSRERREFARAMDSIADAPQFRNGHWGILVVDPATSDTLYSRNAGKLFMPASNQKIITAAVALALLGPDFVYRTPVVAQGTLQDGVLQGHLAIAGRGDPTISGRVFGDAMLPLRRLADSLWNRGLRHVVGDVVADGNAFPDGVLGFGWTYSDLESGYSAAIDELLFNEGVSTIVARGGANVGDLATLGTRPARTFPRVRGEVRTVPRPAPNDSAARRPAISARKDTVTGEIVVTGTVAVGDSATDEVTHRDPSAAFVAAFREALRDRGIRIDQQDARTLARTDTLAVLVSPPMREILPVLMKPSQNQVAEMLLKTIGLERGERGTAAEGRRLVERQLAEWGAVEGGYVVRDGSGLSRYDYVSPETLIRVLDAMRRSPHFTAFYESMPIGGVDGTLRNRMRGTPAERNVRAKTGSVAQSRSLSGYVRTASGRTLLFSTLANNWTVPARDVERAADSLVVRMARLGGGR